jgi:site-specific recombinase XerD
METISFTDAIERLQRFLSSKGLSDHTFKAYETDVKMFWEEMNLDLLDLAKLEDLAAVWLNDRKRVMAIKTSQRRKTSIKSLGMAYKMPILEDFRLPTAPIGRPHPLPGGTDDLQALFDVTYKDEHKLLLVFTGLCGARVSEARAVKPVDIDLVNRTVRLYGKGSKIRYVPISDFAWKILLPLIVIPMAMAPNEVLICLGDRAARAAFTELGVRAKLKRPISSHDLRATFATAAYHKSKDIRAVQELLGHATTRQTELYIFVGDEHLRSAANIMEHAS